MQMISNTPDLLMHITANERTFLAYLRTSSVFATLGVAVVQLFRLTSSSDSTNDVDFGVPFACVCIGLAIIITFCGGFRFWRQQNAIARGKCHAGGWEVYLVGGIGLTVRCIWSCDVSRLLTEKRFCCSLSASSWLQTLNSILVDTSDLAQAILCA